MYGLWGFRELWGLIENHLGGQPKPMGYSRLWVMTAMGYDNFDCPLDEYIRCYSGSAWTPRNLPKKAIPTHPHECGVHSPPELESDSNGATFKVCKLRLRFGDGAAKSHNFKLKIEVDDVDEVSTYVIACEYFVNLEARFQKHFPDQLDSVKKIKRLAHTCLGRHTWSVLGISTDIRDAKEQYIEKRNHFIALSISFKDRLSEWEAMQIPSQGAIYRKMLADDENFASSLIPKSKIAKFLDRGLRIQESQHKLRQLIRDTAEHELQARQKEILNRTTKLRAQFSDFRKDQKHFMPKVGDKVAAQSTASPAIQDERLYLPSDFTAVERNEMGLTELAREEERWREGQAFDYLRAVQNAVKALSALRNRKTKNERQQKQNTRAGGHIEEGMRLQQRHMESYNAARLAIIALAGSTTFPPLTEADLFMKSVQQIRHVGDSKRTDGLLFRARALRSLGSHDHEGDVEMEVMDQEEEQTPVGTQMDKRRSGPKPKKSRANGTKPTRPERPEGWLWQLGKLTKMSNHTEDCQI
ncbi:hypothetical protein FB451DRAFT_1173359 [Mycena latifolia]|nr:hypothetical protein FB451DRAFT_1173359 [Mycena latifolia]